MKNFKNLISLLSSQEIKQGSFLTIMILIMALLEVTGVASLLPFITILANPSIIESNKFLSSLFEFSTNFGVKTKNDFLFFLGLLIFAILITSLSFKAITTYVQVKFVMMREYSIGKRLINIYLNQPYVWFLSRNSAELGKNILSEVSTIIANGLYPLMEIIVNFIIVIVFLVLLVVLDPRLTIIICLSLSLSYLVIFYFVRNFLYKIGQIRQKNNTLRFTSLSEAFGATKAIKVGGLEEVYIKNFSNYSKTYAKKNASLMVVSQLPRFILEAIMFGGVLLIILYMMHQFGSLNSSLPIISLFVFAGYRLIPAFQMIYRSFTKITFTSSLIEKLSNEYKSLQVTSKIQDQRPLKFNKEINLNNISFSYPSANKTTLTDINLTIPIKSTVGLIGPTGCGKTTTLDIILGLIEPQKGTLEVDGEIINKNNLRSWQQLIGYVPQSIYLNDDTVMANIAFGENSKEINQDLVKKVAKMVCIDDFIMEELPEQYQTKIGERGVRLSGGQCQRIGIARALYRNPQILILDEATSALDNVTEKLVMNAINSLNKKLTIIIVTHRLNTIENCDVIFQLEKGKLLNKGNYNKN